MGKWVVVYESEFPCRGTLKCECDKCGYIKYAVWHDLRWGKESFIMPNYCEDCGDKKENTVIYPTK